MLAAGSAKPQQPPPNKSAILDDIFNSQATQIPQGPDYSFMTGPMKWTPPAPVAPLATSQGFTPSNFTNNFLANLPEDLEEKELNPSSRRAVEKPHHNGNMSDSDGEEGGPSKAKGPAPAKTLKIGRAHV